ncbi:MAG: Fibronectin/fibrinogen-binding protein [Candidatus Ozemobacter sibiricus]|jgi:predicted ribosome quality control (RQC) complex YloA/Tae2 family protein|uniref:Fibronectin/fibrinogen-binding protein n=1 Tax=Candidatus Ozemobacter sibiricus TaxID=2268124 RepID=A0A367ZJC8_9BACT|nr:MAG: Fibronectin/fibrinogen-binding protein [Candidatus Ozemobacter sibiricus]
MDFFTLRRQIAEIKQRFAAPPQVVKALDLAPEGYGLLLKAPEGWFCLEIHLVPDHQGIWLSRQWDEAPVESSLTRTLNRLSRDGWMIGLTLYSSAAFPPDRVVQLSLTVRDRFFATKKISHLLIELTGRVANLLVCDESLTVLDLHRATGNNRLRMPYRPPVLEGPPPVGHLGTPGEAELVERVLAGPPASWKGRLANFSPLMTRELAWRCAAAGPAGEAAAPRRALWEALVAEATGPGPVSVYRQDGKVRAVVPVELRHLAEAAERLTFPTVDEAMAWVDAHEVRAVRLARAREQARARFAADLAARLRLHAELTADLARYRDGERYQHWGHLLLANLPAITPGATSVTLTDWETGAPVEIPLDPARSGPANAQRLFKLCKKAMRGREEVGRRLAALDEEIAWLREQIWLCETATSPADLMLPPRRAGRRAATVDQGSREGKEAARRLKPLLELDGCRFYVGRNGRQNDLLTFSLARKTDVWCHANDVPGSHVIVKRPDGPPTPEDRRRGAVLAAWFSFARQAGKVAVDVTEVAHVRRIPGGGPGRVSYTHQKTYYVDPSEARTWLEGAAPTGGDPA